MNWSIDAKAIGAVVKYRAMGFHPASVTAVYIAATPKETSFDIDPNAFKVFEIDAKGRTVRESIVPAHAVPPRVQREARELYRYAYNQVRLLSGESIGVQK